MKIAYLFDWYGEILSEKQQLAVELYYNDDLSLSEVAAQLGISRQGVRDSLKRSEYALLDMESKLGLAARFQSMVDEIDAIRQNAAEIEQLAENDELVRTRAAKILECAEALKKSF